MKQSKIVKWYCVLAAASLIFLVYINTNYRNKDVDTYNHKKVIHFKEGWVYVDEAGNKEAIHLPMKKKIIAGHTYTIMNTLPTTGEEGSVLCFKSNHLLVKAYIENQLVYSYTIDDSNTIGKSPGCSFCFVPISVDSFGKEIKIEYTTVYESSSNHILDFRFGEKTIIVTSIIRSNLHRLILCAIIFLIGLIFIITYLVKSKTIYLEKRKTIYISKNILYLGMMALSFSIWSVTETQVLQFFIPNSYVIQYITYLSLGLISVPFLLYNAEIHYQAESILVKVLNGISLLCTATGLVLQVFGWMDLPEFTLVLHLNLFVTACYSIYYTFKEEIWLNKQRKNRRVLPKLPMLVILACGCIDLLRFHLKEKEDFSKFVRIGFIIYIVSVGIKSMIQTRELEKENQYLETLAYNDALSGLSNQTAFMHRCSQIENSGESELVYGILKLRILKLGEIEKKYGSYAKEEMIKTTSKLVHHAFSKYGNCYRVKENEFAVIMERDIQNAYRLGDKNFKQRLRNCNLSRADKLEIVMEFEEKMLGKVHGGNNEA